MFVRAHNLVMCCPKACCGYQFVVSVVHLATPIQELLGNSIITTAEFQKNNNGVFSPIIEVSPY
jgi:hypothetical protein